MKLVDFKQLENKWGITYSRDHLRRKCKAGDFPKPIPISDRRIAWLEDEIVAWLNGRAAERDLPQPKKGVAQSGQEDAVTAASVLMAAPE